VRKFDLYESLLWAPTEGYFLFDRHLARLSRSAHHFGFAFDAASVREHLERFAATLEAPRKVRASLDANGDISIQAEDVKPSTPVRLALAKKSIDSSDEFLRHKTTRRTVYEEALAAHPDAADVLLWNERLELTETCAANVVFVIDGRRVTPPESVGLLPGTFRAHLLDAGEIEEGVVAVDQLPCVEEMFIINSVRRWCKARVI
jgi:para-aminobenzoate synthetase/4-amino-4-deoxychorismate lyase